MTTIILSLLACAQPEPDAPQAPILVPSVVECSPGSAMNVDSLGPLWSVTITSESGSVSAPMMQMLSDSLIVYCPDTGGTITVEWGD